MKTFPVLLLFTCCCFVGCRAEVPGSSTETREHLSKLDGRSAAPTEQNASANDDIVQNIARGDTNESNQLLYALGTNRDESSRRTLLAALEYFASSLPSVLPTMEEMRRIESQQQAERKYDPDHWTAHFGKAMRAAKLLRMLDHPEATQAAERFRTRIHTLWKGSEVGEYFIGVVDSELKQAEENLKAGAVPWKQH